MSTYTPPSTSHLRHAGWALINVHQARMAAAAFASATERLAAAGAPPLPPGGLAALVAGEKARAAASKGFVARLFSLKAVHGALMFTSWLNIAGRIFASNQRPDSFSCYTTGGEGWGVAVGARGARGGGVR